jgi:hypothetical protein
MTDPSAAMPHQDMPARAPICPAVQLVALARLLGRTAAREAMQQAGWASVDHQQKGTSLDAPADTTDQTDAASDPA